MASGVNLVRRVDANGCDVVLGTDHDRFSEWSLSASMMRDLWRTGIDRVVARRDNASCSEVKTRWD